MPTSSKARSKAGVKGFRKRTPSRKPPSTKSSLRTNGTWLSLAVARSYGWLALPASWATADSDPGYRGSNATGHVEEALNGLDAKLASSTMAALDAVVTV
jgi:hypothetical protein